ncbi:DUF5703 domain-containing protein [Rubritalea marina]|uniref:DUF5703 domain-containing protein n=1 Tax=Rubritalea marina TaxID=361055 RepID=UPI0012E9FEEA|nr:DUF5703 domain-containing protein [Rubritalea marina]
MMKKYRIILAVMAAGVSPLLAATLDKYDVVWDSPSENCHGSMPIGNGDLAANVWVEPNGDLVFLLSKSDSWSAHQELMKLGRIRVRLDKPLVAANAKFEQRLDLDTGTIQIQGAGKTLQFWIDANNPVVNVQIQGDEAYSAKVMLETWRAAGKPMSGGAVPDVVLPAKDNSLRWYQRNVSSIFQSTFDTQHLGESASKYHDPLKHLTFGCVVSGEGLVSQDQSNLVTAAPTKSLNIQVHALTAQTDTPDAWVQQIEAQQDSVEAKPLAQTRQAHDAYWKGFWSRSHIYVSGSPEAEQVTNAYVLQRWMQSCAGRGAYPIKFNGSLFTVDGLIRDHKTKEVRDHGPDWRQWGGPYWFQNTRLSYWPMLYSGDYAQMKSLWEMYRKAIPLLQERTKTYFKHEGIYFSETMHPWGLNRIVDFGRNNPGFIPQNPYMKYNWDCGFELSLMMLDYYAHTGDQEFAKTTLIPIADEVLKFYDQHYKRAEDGTVKIYPSMALETWQDTENPLPVVAGLRSVLDGMLALPASLSSAAQRANWQRFLGEIPPVPFAEENGKKWLTPGKVFKDLKNSETPELYAVFPYRLYSVAQPDVEMAREAYHRRRNKMTGGWRQDPIQAAMLGLTDEAKMLVVTNATNRSPIGMKQIEEARFPAIWGPNFDWLPDQCHGSVTMIALQRMIMLPEGEKIHLLPAWPSDWNAEFKLNAPKNTVVEAKVEGGKVVELKVTPESRRKDVVIIGAQ